MSFVALAEPLRRVPLFEGLEPVQIIEIARRAERVTFRPGETIIRENALGDAAYLIVSGEAERTSSPAGRAPETIGPGSLVGEMAMLVETAYSSTIVSKAPVRALKITRDGLQEYMRSDLSLARHFVEKLTGRLQSLANDLRKIDGTLSADRMAMLQTAKPPTRSPAIA